MTDKQFTFRTAAIVGIAAAIAAGVAVKKTRAQITEVKPFTAIETTTLVAGAGHGRFVQDGTTQTPVPTIYTKVIAVRSDGSVALVQKFEPASVAGKEFFFRTVFDTSKKTKTLYDQFTESVVNYPYHEDHSMKGNELCEGTADGKIEGFDVVFFQTPVEPLSDGEILTDKSWAAPKLGCFVLKNEKIDMHEGQLMFHSIKLLSNLTLGEPDPWYFSDAPTYKTRAADEWKDELIRRYPVAVVPQ